MILQSGAITEVVHPSFNLTRAIVGIDYEAIYLLDSRSLVVAILADLPLPSTAPISWFEFQPTRLATDLVFRVNLCFSFTGSLPHTRAFVSAFYDGQPIPGSLVSMLIGPSTTPGNIKMIISV